MVAEIIINRSAKKLNRTFDYNIPKLLLKTLRFCTQAQYQTKHSRFENPVWELFYSILSTLDISFVRVLISQANQAPEYCQGIASIIHCISFLPLQAVLACVNQKPDLTTRPYHWYYHNTKKLTWATWLSLPLLHVPVKILFAIFWWQFTCTYSI